MGGCLNKIGLHGHPLDTDVRVLKEPRTVPYNRIGSPERIRTVSVPYRTVSRGPPPEDEVDVVARMHSDQRGNSMTIGKPFQKGRSGNRDMAKARADRMVARANEQPPSDPVESLCRRAERLSTVATGLKKLADAEELLYKSLDDAQKQRFEILTQAIRFHRHMGSDRWRKPSEHDDRIGSLAIYLIEPPK